MSEELKPLPGDLAAAFAHRACCGVEHDTSQGKLHGYCVVCGVEWPCETARYFLRYSPTEQQQAARIAELEQQVDHLKLELGHEEGAHQSVKADRDRFKAEAERLTDRLIEACRDGSASAAKLSDIQAVAKEMAEALEVQAEAMDYAGVGDDRPHNRLILLIESRRLESIGDNWDYWNYLSEKLQAAQSVIIPALAKYRATQ